MGSEKEMLMVLQGFDALILIVFDCGLWQSGVWTLDTLPRKTVLVLYVDVG